MLPRAANECEFCRQRKVRSSGEQPCRDCVKHKWDCIFGNIGHKLFSEAWILPNPEYLFGMPRWPQVPSAYCS
ncbi:hypothetical protein N7495_004186 [Penicillium taxi]|uniref:uncharacterized protein n=1 Tax=Penicillium taxi TaxID=168475 RepID=UPI0025450F61|nr:uncharacterized protein N7495_004186 [Penicillium taxi]KAJ5899442.1 hypothetical protein N7495_004186 [Penicillium taxi]